MHKVVTSALALFICACIPAFSVKAKVYWLPDYLEDNLDRNADRVSDDNGHKTSAANCSNYGWIDASRKGNLKCTGYQILPGGTVCYKGCYDPCKNITAADCGNLKCLSYWQDCPDKCKTCETCTPTDCSGFTLSAPPANASYSSCSPGCGDNDTRYKLLSCNDGYSLIQGKCTDPCKDLADNETDLGCEKYYDQCPTLCEVGKNEVKCDSGFHPSADKLSCEADACEGFTLNSCPTGAVSCNSCKSGTVTKYQITGCKEGYTQISDTCTNADCDGFTLSSCPSRASCSSCKSGTSTKYKIDQCNPGYELNGSGSCSKTDCQNKGYSLYSCPSIATDCETCLSGTRTYYRIKSCTIPLAVSSDRKSCICPSNAVVTDEASLRLAFSKECPIITVSGTINMTDTRSITVHPNTTKFTGTNNALLSFPLQDLMQSFVIEESPETPFEISNLDFSVDSGKSRELLTFINRPTKINNISVNFKGTSDIIYAIIYSFNSDIHINNLNFQADTSTSRLFSPIEFANSGDYSRSFSIKNSEIIANNTGDGSIEALRFKMNDNSSSYINIENTTIALNTVGSNYAIWVQEMLTSGYIELKASGCSISAKSDFSEGIEERNDFNSLTYINRAGEFSIVTQ